MIVMPSDHAISDTERFLSDLRLAVQGAQKDYLITFGIKPSRPETGYGYIKADRSSKTGVEGHLKVERFVEKPDLQTAKTYLSEGSYFWNSGIFVWKTAKILSEIEHHLPSLYKTLKEIEAILFEPDELNRPIQSEKLKRSSIPQSAIPDPQWYKLYAGLESVSID
jgi:mannose-1-phosphate guanylyltransferase